MESGTFEGFWHRFEQSQLYAPALKRRSYGSDTSITSRRREKQTRNSLFPHSAYERTEQIAINTFFFASFSSWQASVGHYCQQEAGLYSVDDVSVCVGTDWQTGFFPSVVSCLCRNYVSFYTTTCPSTPPSLVFCVLCSFTAVICGERFSWLCLVWCLMGVKQTKLNQY